MRIYLGRLQQRSQRTGRSALRFAGMLGLAAAGLLVAAPDARAAVGEEAQFIYNTFAFLIWGVLVMWMCAGFTMLESGSVRTKNASVICLKNIGLYSIAGLAYYLVGYNLMYVDVGSFIGSVSLLFAATADEIAVMGGDAASETVAAVIATGKASMSDWFFQMVFVATTASIVSGALAERVKLWSFFVFTAVLTTIIYPIIGAWTWGGGWLSAMGFQDFAGSTIVHSTGGWAALAGAIVVGPRLGKFRKDGSVKPTPPSNVPGVTLGVFILWMGWFGFNGGSQLALGSAADTVAMSHILVNTNLGAGAGVIAAIAMVASDPGAHRPDGRPERRDCRVGGDYRGAGHRQQFLGGRHRRNRRRAVPRGDQTAGNMAGGRRGRCGAGPPVRRRVGNVGGLYCGGREPIGPAHRHRGGGGLRVSGRVWAMWQILARTMGARVERDVELLGQDVAELGIEAYPEFVLLPEEDIE